MNHPEIPPEPIGNIPAEQKGFIGRHQELSALQRMLLTARLVTLTGPGGVGKTRPALRAAAEAAAAFPDGAWLVELSGLHDGELLVHAVSAALRATDHTTRP